MSQKQVDDVSAKLAAPVVDNHDNVAGVFIEFTDPSDLPEEPTTESPFLNPVSAPGVDSLPAPPDVRGVERPLPDDATAPADATAQATEPEQPVVPTNPDAEGEQITDPTHPADAPVELQPDPAEVHEHKVEADKLGVEAEFASRTEDAQAAADERAASEDPQADADDAAVPAEE